MTVSSGLSKPRRWTCRAVSACVAALILATTGCGGPRPCVVSGKVLVDRRPTGGVYVIFHTVGGPTARPDSGSTRSGDDGSFSLVVSDPGDTVVTAFWPSVTVKDHDTIEGADRFGGVYRDPQRPVAKATIHEGDNSLPPISLARPAPGKTPTRGRR